MISPAYSGLTRVLVSLGLPGYEYNADSAYAHINLASILRLLEILKHKDEHAFLSRVRGYHAAHKVAPTWEWLITQPDLSNHIQELYPAAMACTYGPADAPGLCENYQRALQQWALYMGQHHLAGGGSASDVLSSLTGALTSNQSTQADFSTKDGVESVKARLEELQDRMKRRPALHVALPSIDSAIGGFYSALGDLISVFAHTSHGKSAFGYYFAYMNMLRGRRGLIIVLEDTAHKPMSVLYSMHSLHKKFAGNQMCIPYHAILKLVDPDNPDRSLLSDSQQKILFDEVIPDFEALPGEVIGLQRSSYTVEDLRADLSNSGSDPEHPLDYFVLDYPALMKPIPRAGRSDVHQDNAQIFKDIRSLCTTFNDGAGILGLLLAQAKDDAAKDAGSTKKGRGRYEAGSMAFSAEIARSSTHVFSILMNDEMRQAGQCVIQTHKSRNSAFPPTIVCDFDGMTQMFTESDVKPDEYFKVADETAPRRFKSNRFGNYTNEEVRPVPPAPVNFTRFSI